MWTVVVALVAVAATALADARTDYLVRALRTSDMFRVRTQAAISLGAVPTEPQVVRVLSDALRDENPAVRAAAASSLGRQGDPSALTALRRLNRDPERAVRHAAEASVRALERVERSTPNIAPVPGGGGQPSGGGADRYYVAVGRPATTVRNIGSGMLDSAQRLIRQTCGGMSGVRLAPEQERSSAARRVIAADSLVGYYLDISITSIQERPNGGLRASVSVVVQTYPGRNIRSMLNGAATVMGASGATAQRQAIEGALRGALRNLPQAMAASAASAEPPRSGSTRRRRRRRR